MKPLSRRDSEDKAGLFHLGSARGPQGFGLALTAKVIDGVLMKGLNLSTLEKGCYRGFCGMLFVGINTSQTL